MVQENVAGRENPFPCYGYAQYKNTETDDRWSRSVAEKTFGETIHSRDLL